MLQCLRMSSFTGEEIANIKLNIFLHRKINFEIYSQIYVLFLSPLWTSLSSPLCSGFVLSIHPVKDQPIVFLFFSFPSSYTFLLWPFTVQSKLLLLNPCLCNYAPNSISTLTRTLISLFCICTCSCTCYSFSSLSTRCSFS